MLARIALIIRKFIFEQTKQSTLGNTVCRDGRVKCGVKPNLFACNLLLGCYSTPSLVRIAWQVFLTERFLSFWKKNLEGCSLVSIHFALDRMRLPRTRRNSRSASWDLIWSSSTTLCSDKALCARRRRHLLRRQARRCLTVADSFFSHEIGRSLTLAFPVSHHSPTLLKCFFLDFQSAQNLVTLACTLLSLRIEVFNFQTPGPTLVKERSTVNVI